ncbi:hypothetical protein HJG60_017990 [Phyllostomus discolor]|uniref:Uncharacterized protein n=1 Tax=Phyllostomus discolor TaxID=89673 RepID=A0A834B724_9CHIR|nr:hypothetical protein HJG60_017990 [Phyllostomus discolor]
MDRQVKTGSPSFVNPDIQKLLEILMAKKEELKIWKEKEKDGSCLEQKILDFLLNSLENIWKSLGAEQNLTTPQTFWSMKDRPKHVSSPQ